MRQESATGGESLKEPIFDSPCFQKCDTLPPKEIFYCRYRQDPFTEPASGSEEKLMDMIKLPCFIENYLAGVKKFNFLLRLLMKDNPRVFDVWERIHHYSKEGIIQPGRICLVNTQKNWVLRH